MTSFRKLMLYGGVSMLALTATAGTASAFDRVDWSWDAEVVDRINKRITIDVAFDPSGMVHVEIPQIHIGDSTATAITHDVWNKPGASYEERTFDFTATGQTDPEDSLDVSGTAEGFVDIDNTPNSNLPGQQSINGLIGIAGTPGGSSQSDGGVGLVDGSLGDEPAGLTVDGETSGSLGVTVSGSITVPVVVPLDAVDELPKLENIATALANNLSIESDRMVEAHAGQFAFGDGGLGGFLGLPGGPGVESASLGGGGLGGNTHLALAELLTLGAVLGLIEPAEVNAYAETHHVRNVQVENAATAIANNMSIDLEAATAGDGVLIGDLTQFAYADVSAEAYLGNAKVRNYSNLGNISGPLFANTATSIGNNMSIKVKSPSVNLPGGGNE